ncbi:MAG: hypothetical protein HQK65_10570 [Desulfamplus sp.]|nr:hypothetical protein [Desulfamplus sp.]
MPDNIHKKLVLRLSLAWLILSFVIGSVIYIVEQEKIDDFVITLAEAESSKFISDEVQYLENLTPANTAVLRQKTQEHLMTGAFFVIEFYGTVRRS